jgi:hypothetical protein
MRAWQQVLGVNVDGLLYGTNAALPHVPDVGSGAAGDVGEKPSSTSSPAFAGGRRRDRRPVRTGSAYSQEAGPAGTGLLIGRVVCQDGLRHMRKNGVPSGRGISNGSMST